MPVALTIPCCFPDTVFFVAGIMHDGIVIGISFEEFDHECGLSAPVYILISHLCTNSQIKPPLNL